jgi:hypothetical protein
MPNCKARNNCFVQPNVWPFPKEKQIKPHITMALVLGLVLSSPCKADIFNEFVRIACVPENGMLDIDTRRLHDSVSSTPKGQSKDSDSALANAGFYQPRKLKFTCELGDIKYVIEADQGEATNFMCGASPEISLNVKRNGIPVFADVPFGKSCTGRPSVMRITIGDGNKSWRGREMETCYATGEDLDVRHCEWTSGQDSVFAKRYPVNEAALKRITAPFKQKK